MEDILDDLDLKDKPIITALNKIDLMLDNTREWNEEEAIDFISSKCPAEKNTAIISADKGWGLTNLLVLINRILAQPDPSVIPP